MTIYVTYDIWIEDLTYDTESSRHCLTRRLEFRQDLFLNQYLKLAIL